MKKKSKKILRKLRLGAAPMSPMEVVIAPQEFNLYEEVPGMGERVFASGLSAKDADLVIECLKLYGTVPRPKEIPALLKAAEELYDAVYRFRLPSDGKIGLAHQKLDDCFARMYKRYG